MNEGIVGAPDFPSPAGHGNVNNKQVKIVGRDASPLGDSGPGTDQEMSDV